MMTSATAAEATAIYREIVPLTSGTATNVEALAIYRRTALTPTKGMAEEGTRGEMMAATIVGNQTTLLVTVTKSLKSLGLQTFRCATGVTRVATLLENAPLLKTYVIPALSQVM